ncbi:MAG: hypothetical protein H7330_05330 [Hymenobacteraceae bacterium]|nr:hypothetical protein [Hymenobacteraceae bacterium]
MKKRSAPAFLIVWLSLSAASLLLTSCQKERADSVAPSAAAANPNPTVVANAMSYRLSGLAVTATATGTYLSNSFSVVGMASPQSLVLQVTNPTTSGTITNGSIIYSKSGASWTSSPASGGSSRIEISTFNLVTRKASGTFTATLKPTAGGGDKVVTDGTFTDVSI